jgi:hypothetical protein
MGLPLMDVELNCDGGKLFKRKGRDDVRLVSTTGPIHKIHKNKTWIIILYHLYLSS